jgi:PTH1 family peptidyl-tRNA hydrolase
VGFSLLELFAKEESQSSPQKKWKSLSWSFFDGDVKYLLLLPQTFVNLSGDAVAACLHDNEFELEDLLVVHDEIDLALGEFRYKSGGGEAGHNGLKSISQRITTQKYARLRIGIGPRPSNNLSDFVLKRFSKEQNEVILSRFPLILDSIKFWAQSGIDETMNRFNGKDV